MEFKAESKQLLKALSTVNGAVERRNTIPVLQNIKIVAKDGKLSLFATDMDIMINSVINCDIIAEGETTIPAQMFFDIIRKIPDNQSIIAKQESDSILNIKYGDAKYNLPCIAASEFPNLEEGSAEEEIEVDAKKLSKMIDKTRFAISSDETRYYLNGLYLHISKRNDKNQLCNVATDGHRLALSFVEFDNFKNPFGVIIPKKSVNEIRKIIDNVDSVKLSISRVKIKIKAGDNTMISKLIDGEFPDYNKILPQNNDKIIKISKKNFFDCVDRVSTVANDKHKAIKLTIENNKMELEVSTNDGSFAHEILPIEYRGEKIITGFNSIYLKDVISQIDNDILTLRLKDSMSPALIDGESMDCEFVVMPIRI